MEAKQTDRQAGALQGFALVLPVITVVMGSAILAPNFLLILEAFQEQVPGREAEYLVNAVLTIPALCIAIFSPAMGAIADTFGRRRLLLASLFAYSIIGTLPLWLRDVWAILGSRVLLGVAEAAIVTASTTLIGDYFSGKRRDHWLAMQTTTASIASIFLFPLGGFIGGAFGWYFPFAMYLLAIPLFGLAFLSIHEPLIRENQGQLQRRQIANKLARLYGAGILFVFLCVNLLPVEGLIERIAIAIALLFGLSLPLMLGYGLKLKRTNRSTERKDDFPWVNLSLILTLTALVSIMFYLLQIKLPQALSDMDLSNFLSVGMEGTLKIALVISIAGLGIPIGTVIFSRFSQAPVKHLMIVEFGLMSLGFLGISMAPSIGYIMAFSFINQLGCGMALPTMLTWTMRNLSFAQRGRGAGLFGSYFNGGQFVGPQLLTLIAATYTAGQIKPAFAYVGVVALILLLAVIASGSFSWARETSRD